MVPAQLLTPEIDLDTPGDTPPMKGQMISLLITGFFIVAVIWAALAEIDEVVRAEGEVVPSDNIQMVQTRLPGSVVAINANLGDRVSKGDVLFEVEDEDVRANFADNEIQRLTAQATIHRLKAEANGLDEVIFPPELTEAAPNIVEQERLVFISRKKALVSERQVIEEEVKSLQGGIEEREAEERQASRSIESIEQRIELIKPLVEKGYEPKLTLLNLEQELDEARSREELSQLAAVRMQSDLEAASQRLQSMDNNFRAQAETQLVETQTTAAQTEARLEALTERVAQAEIRAPVDGVITAVHVNTVGGVVEGGSVMAEMVPINDEVTVRARVNTDDVSKISVDQDVRISLSAYDVSRYGTLTGQVHKIANNSTQEQNLPPYFVTIIKIPDPEFEQSGFKPVIVPGMTLIVDVLGGKRTVLNYILSPIQRAQSIAFREK
jgi:HlyD family type I secretion membrane fusion protein